MYTHTRTHTSIHYTNMHLQIQISRLQRNFFPLPEGHSFTAWSYQSVVTEYNFFFRLYRNFQMTIWHFCLIRQALLKSHIFSPQLSKNHPQRGEKTYMQVICHLQHSTVNTKYKGEELKHSSISQWVIIAVGPILDHWVMQLSPISWA